MPIYLARWPGKSLSIVRARDKIELMDILDEIGDVVSCRIKEYRGPLFISLDLGIECHLNQDDSYSIDDVSHCLEEPVFDLSGDAGDTIVDMNDEITKFAFPAYYQYLEERRENRLEQSPNAQDEILCKAALQKDFVEPLEPSQKKRIDQSLKWADAMGILDIKRDQNNDNIDD